MKYFFLLILSFIIFNCNKTEQPLSLASVFTDNMVLQQKKSIWIWGKATPGQQVEVQLADQKVKVKTSAEGRWKVKLMAMPAGGPFKLTVKSAQQQISLKNVLIGEVWLCSGQSNMEMPMKGWPPEAPVEGSEQEIAAADFPEIRLFTVPRNASLQPSEQIKSSWQVCSPQTVKNFSATAYFFGKKLYQELGVPIGLIHSSWGGTPAEAWTAPDCLEAMEEFKDIAQKLEQIKPALAALEKWRASLQQIPVEDLNDSTFWKSLDINDQRYTTNEIKGWQAMQLPGRWEENGLEAFDGIVWFKRVVKIPHTWLDKTLVLELCPIDDMDRTYFNGQKVGGKELMGFWNLPRRYEIPAYLVREKNMIAIRVIDTQGAGGLWGKPEKMTLSIKGQPEQKIELQGEWYFRPIAEYQNKVFYVYGEKEKDYQNRPRLALSLNSHTPAALYNGMIHPLIPFSVRGVIWYQGEANVGRAEQYRQLFPLMINCWRQKWDQGDFPFYFVQIAPYDYGEQSRSQLLREAQLMTLQVKNTGMVVTTDIGDDQNIHPAKKEEVGRRLALWALAKNYGRNDLVYSGPIFEKMEKAGNKLCFHFKFTDGGLLLKKYPQPQFLIAGVDKKFLPAKVKIAGNALLVWHPEIKQPVAVRYGWSNTPHAVLFNKAGLPASPFRTDQWQE